MNNEKVEAEDGQEGFGKDAEVELPVLNVIKIDEIESDLLKDLLKSFDQKKLQITKEEDRKGLPTYKIRIFTEKHGYSISAVIGHYLGCIMINRSPHPGEDHTRGSDFPDGDFSFSTWLRIVYKILSYEALEIYKPRSGIKFE